MIAGRLKTLSQEGVGRMYGRPQMIDFDLGEIAPSKNRGLDTCLGACGMPIGIEARIQPSDQYLEMLRSYPE